MLSLLPPILGGASGGAPSSIGARKRGLLLNQSRMGMHLLRASPPTYTVQIGTLTFTETSLAPDVAPGAVDLTAAGFTDWISPRGNGDYTLVRKATSAGGTTPTNIIGPPQGSYGTLNGPTTIGTAIFANFAPSPAAAPADSWTDGVTEAGVTSSGSRPGGSAMQISDSGAFTEPRGGAYTFPADTTPHTAEIHFAQFVGTTPANSAVRVQASISGSGGPAAVDIPLPSSNAAFLWTRYIFSYSAPTDGRTLTVKLVVDSTGGRTLDGSTNLIVARVGYRA